MRQSRFGNVGTSSTRSIWCRAVRLSVDFAPAVEAAVLAPLNGVGRPEDWHDSCAGRPGSPPPPSPHCDPSAGARLTPAAGRASWLPDATRDSDRVETVSLGRPEAHAAARVRGKA